jgi:hypothetical protein
VSRRDGHPCCKPTSWSARRPRGQPGTEAVQSGRRFRALHIGGSWSTSRRWPVPRSGPCLPPAAPRTAPTSTSGTSSRLSGVPRVRGTGRRSYPATASSARGHACLACTCITAPTRTSALNAYRTSCRSALSATRSSISCPVSHSGRVTVAFGLRRRKPGDKHTQRTDGLQGRCSAGLRARLLSVQPCRSIRSRVPPGLPPSN